MKQQHESPQLIKEPRVKAPSSLSKRLGLLAAGAASVAGLAIGANKIASNDNIQPEVTSTAVANPDIVQNYDSRHDPNLMDADEREHHYRVEQKADGSFIIEATYPSTDRSAMDENDQITLSDGILYQGVTTLEVYSEKSINIASFDVENASDIVISEVTGEAKYNDTIFTSRADWGDQSRLYSIDNPQNQPFTVTVSGVSSAQVHIWQGEALVPVADLPILEQTYPN